jgi:iron uptake system EfeUOB component EfeO/EfeM
LKLRQRQVKKELERLDSLYKKSKAFYDTVKDKDCPVARLLYNRMQLALERLNTLKRRGV